MNLTEQQTRLLAACSRAIAHRDQITAAAAVERIRQNPTLLAELAADATSLQSALANRDKSPRKSSPETKSDP